MKAISSINLTYRNKSWCIFWWFVHGSVLEQTLCIPLTKSTHFSLSEGIAAIPGQHQVNDDPAKWDRVPRLFQNQDCHVAPSLRGAPGILPEALASSPTDQLVAQSITKFRNFSFLFPWMLNFISVLFSTPPSLFFFLNLHAFHIFSVQLNLSQLFHVKSCSNTWFHKRDFNLCLVQRWLIVHNPWKKDLSFLPVQLLQSC